MSMAASSLPERVGMEPIDCRHNFYFNIHLIGWSSIATLLM